MGMEDLKDSLKDWIADTAAMWVMDDEAELSRELIENAIQCEMDSLGDDMYDAIDEIMERTKKMIEECQEDEER